MRRYGFAGFPAVQCSQLALSRGMCRHFPAIGGIFSGLPTCTLARDVSDYLPRLIAVLGLPTCTLARDVSAGSAAYIVYSSLPTCTLARDVSICVRKRSASMNSQLALSRGMCLVTICHRIVGYALPTCTLARDVSPGTISPVSVNTAPNLHSRAGCVRYSC